MERTRRSAWSKASDRSLTARPRRSIRRWSGLAQLKKTSVMFRFLPIPRRQRTSSGPLWKIFRATAPGKLRAVLGINRAEEPGMLREASHVGRARVARRSGRLCARSQSGWLARGVARADALGAFFLRGLVAS